MSTEIEQLRCQVRQLEGELLAAKARVDAIRDASGDIFGCMEWRLEQDGSLRLTSANAMASQLLRRDCGALVGQTFETVFPGLQVTTLGAEVRTLARDGGAIGPMGLLGEGMLSGQAFHCLAFQSDSNRVVVKFWDRADPADSAKLRMRAQQQMAAIFSHSPAAISLSRLSDGFIVDVNAQWSQDTGIGLSQALGHTAAEIGLWGHVEQYTAWLQTDVGDGRLAVTESSFLRSDGQRRVFQHSGSRVEIGGTQYLLTYLRDVTREHITSAELLASEQLLQAANTRLEQQVEIFEELESLALVGYWVADWDTGEVQWSNGLYQLGGLPAGSVRNFADAVAHVHPEDLPRLMDAGRSMSGELVEYRWLHPDGKTRWVRTRMRRKDEANGRTRDLGVVQDITAEHEAAQVLKERLGFIQKITSRAPGMVFQLRRYVDGSYKFLYVGEPIVAIYRGLTPEQVLADPQCALRFHHPEDVDRFLATMAESGRNLTPWQQEYRLIFADGDIRWLLGQAVPEREEDGAITWNGFVTDITERQLAKERLQASEARFRALTDLSSDWYWEQDAQFRFVRIDGNPQSRGPIGDSDMLGKTRWESGAEGLTASDWAMHRADLMAHRTFHDFQMRRRRKDGSVIWASISGAPIFDDKGAFVGYRGIGRDISERKRDEDRIERLAFYDALTGLPNRRLLMDRLHGALALRDRDGSIGAILFIDLDNFKDLNDTRGHDIGDELLKQVAVRLCECVRDADTVARLGGDEFVVMLQMLSPIGEDAAADVESVGRKILQALNQPYRLGGVEHHSTPSMGVAMFQDADITIEELLKRADLAMYQAKAAGRNTLRFFDPAMQAAATARATVETDLRQALLVDELVLYYQPVVDSYERTTGVEALVRWVHPVRGIVNPSDFIPVAEQTGLIMEVGLWVLRAACKQLVLWSGSARTRDLSISVNVSARQFRSPGFTDQVLDVLRHTGANPYRLKLELTESLLLTDFADVTLKISELRSIGVSFSLDDFGTGYSSLSYLKQLPLDHLKIDQSFVRGVLNDPNDAAIARTILTLAASLDLGVVAEGVELAGQRDFLMENGCRSFQGYLFGRPVPVQMLDLRETASSRFSGL
jgi:diguanylate cyclase (GGDEF)-like protein/PAS domain S-box-containing protein